MGEASTARLRALLEDEQRVQKCLYKGRVCEVREVFQGGEVRIMTLDGRFAMSDGGWERVDKFEWERTVERSEIQLKWTN